jgi:hypothetical protein
MNHIDEDNRYDMMRALEHLNSVVCRMRIDHEHSRELLDIIKKLEDSKYSAWLASKAFEEIRQAAERG